MGEKQAEAETTAWRSVGDEVALLLVAHQQIASDECLCGWAEWGLSQAIHVAQELRAAGLLA